MTQPPPHSDEAERAVLGSILRGGADVFSVVSNVVSYGDFYKPAHSLIFEAASDIDAIDVQTVGLEIQTAGNLAAIGGALYLSELLDAVVTVANAEHYASVVKDLSRRREMIRAAQAVIDSGYAQGESTEDYLATSKAYITAAGECDTDSGAVVVGDCIDEAIEAAIDSEPPAGVIKSVVGDIDPSILTIISGRPSMGKSATALNVLTNAALAGDPSVYFSMEEPRLAVMFRILARFADVDHERIKEHTTDDEEKARIRAARDVIGCMPLYIDETGSLTPEQMRHRCIIHQQRHGMKLAVFDNLGNFKMIEGSLFEQYTDATKKIAVIPKELGIAAILISQLNRSVDSRDKRIPMMSDLRQTGALEELAKHIIFIMRESQYPDVYPDADEHKMNIYVAKRTGGRCGQIERYCDMSRMLVRKQDAVEPRVWAPPARNGEY